MKNKIISLTRQVTGPFLFSKSLPADFNRQKVIVTSRSDIRLLAPGLQASAGDLFNVCRKYVKLNDVVWDIGSNLGILAFSAAVKTGKLGRVFSLEADPRYADIQSRTLKGFSEQAGQVSILCAAVADQSGILDLVIPRKGHSRNHLSMVSGNSAGESEMKKQVVTLTLDWLLEYWVAPNFIKIDIEGAELLAVLGGSRLFSEIRPVGYVECSAGNVEPMTRYFREKDYLLFKLDDTGNEQAIENFAFNTIVKPKEQC
ncbi:MAG: FkbM family methyltransferase [Coraliomargaritaceae bacterium]